MTTKNITNTAYDTVIMMRDMTFHGVQSESVDLPKDDNILLRMFEHLTNLRKINLHSTYISLVPEVLNTLPHLNSIILQGNKIDRWNAKWKKHYYLTF
jgi:hypothetical protein